MESSKKSDMRAAGSSEGTPRDLSAIRNEPRQEANEERDAPYNQEERIPGHIRMVVSVDRH